MFDLRSAGSLVLLAGAVAMLPPTADGLREFGRWCVRPARLPFAWQALTTASTNGEAREAFARGQQIMQLVPSWTDGHAAFVYQYVLTNDASADRDTIAAAAEKRLHAGLAVLEQAREFAGKREHDLLRSAAFLPEVACAQFPGLAERLAPHGGAAKIADAYLQEAERLFPTQAIREQRLWHTPKLAGALLACGAQRQALAVMDAAIARIPEVRDQALATEWRDRLLEITAWLRGDRNLSLDAVFADPRFEPLWPHLR